MKAFAVSVLAWVLLPLLALAQEKVELNRITSVRVNGGAVEITGSKKPNFTTFTMTDPPRLVIDISEAVLAQVPGELPASNGLITGLRTANYGSDASAIARVLIGYERDVETDIQVSGNVLVVKVLDQAGGPLLAQAPTLPDQPDETTANTGTPEQAAGAARTETGAQTQAAQEATAAANTAATDPVKAAEQAKLAEEERRKQEAAARAEAAKKAEDERRAVELAAAEEKKRQEDEARAAAEAKKVAEAEEKKRKADEAEARRLAAAEEKKRQEDEARAAAEAKKVAEADEKRRKAEEAEARRVAAAEEKKRRDDEARATAEAKKLAETEEKRRKAEEAEARRVASAEEKKRRDDEARAAADARKLADAEDKRRRDAEAEATRLAAVDKRRQEADARVANVAPPPRREEPVSPTPATEASPAGKRRTLEIVGFQQQAGASRVYIRTNEPVRYKVSEGRKEIILELENTQIGKGNNTRALDTSFFDTAVARVDPTVGPDRSVRVSIKLKADVPVRTRQEGNTISLDFPRPE
ncbi:MAG TPA: AMIN domain-containing protein [Myxococcaceae bacterium]